ncbi:hypothetical protein ACO0LM_12040 [Undibacterium sp. Di26W]|uniref:hypothetical protein n=1 Tax=Undibacterium sp. Di26W TaxID=3413035 RepID=UPI003BF0D65B
MNKKINTGFVLRNLQGMYIVLHTYQGHGSDRYEVKETYILADATVFYSQLALRGKIRDVISSDFPNCEEVPVRITTLTDIVKEGETA